MAFTAPSVLEAVYCDIQTRKEQLGSLSLVEFDDAEYQVLLEWTREIIQNYERWMAWKQEKARPVFLAFVFEYLRHTHYVDDNRFWDEFEDTVGIGRNEHRNLMYEIFELAFDQENIKLEQKQRRLFVRTLFKEVKDAKSTRQDCIDFFCWYYQQYWPTKKPSEAVVTVQLLQRYADQERKALSIEPKAIPTLSEDCQTLANIIDYATEHDLFMAQMGPGSYQQTILSVSKAYDLRRIRLIGKRETIANLIIRLENHRTPSQFLRDLHDNQRLWVKAPGKQELRGTAAYQQWKADTLEYGIYRLGEKEYRVVPFSWLRLAMIERWHDEDFVKLPREDYVAYRKSKRFMVQIGGRRVEARKCFLEKGRVCYIWADKVPRGQPLVIDGRVYPDSASVNWEISLVLGFTQDGEPDIVVVFDWLKAFYPDQRGQRLIIRTSQGHEEITYVLDQNGVLQRNRDVSFHLERLDEPVTISIYLGTQQLASKTVQVEKAYLFSRLTQQRIPAGTKREWGDQRYYLFVHTDEVVQAGEGMELDRQERLYGSYAVYEVAWYKEQHPFHLQAGNVSWSFEKQQYFSVQVSHLHTQGPVRLASRQLNRFSKENIQIWTNRNLTEVRSLTCFILHQGVEEVFPVGYQKRSENLYSFDDMTIKHLNSLTVEQQRYGQFDLLFYEDKRGEETGQLLGQTSLSVIPEIQVDAPPLFIEGQSTLVKITSPYLKIWDHRASKDAYSADFLLVPRLIGQSWKNDKQIPKGIRSWGSDPVRIPVTFPVIGETVEVEIIPVVFGFRLYQRQGQADYQQVNQLDYYALETSVLYIHTEALRVATICVNGVRCRTEQADEDGHVLIKDLSFLKRYCERERTSINILSKGLESTFFVCWKPLIHDLTVRENRIDITVSGPQKTGVILELVEASNTIRWQKRITCEAKRLQTSIDLPEIKVSWRQCYLIPSYFLAGDIWLPAAWQQRLEDPTAYRIPVDWLRTGLGISDEMLLQYCTME
jgi:hypothetical protein